MEFIFELIGELLLELIVELLAEAGLHSLVEPFRPSRSRNPILAALGYFMFGAVAGGLSLLIFPKLFLTAGWLRTLNLALTPIVAGLTMSAVGAWRKRRQQELIRLDRFTYGALFALAMALVRYWGGG